ncbi:hypothetical protein I4U23_021985 [Adineta vaga]|nr:hypothetical protein I4U23_021985 [Adineta vaga]
MATSPTETQCIICKKERGTFKCNECLQSFCYEHIPNHRQEQNEQLDAIEVTIDLFHQTLTDYSNKPNENDELFQQINQWEEDSIKKIKQTAEETRQILQTYINELLPKIEVKLNKLTKQLQESRDKNDCMEKDFQQWNQQLIQMNNELKKPSNIQIKQSSIPLINKINIEIFTGKI